MEGKPVDEATGEQVRDAVWPSFHPETFRHVCGFLSVQHFQQQHWVLLRNHPGRGENNQHATSFQICYLPAALSALHTSHSAFASPTILTSTSGIQPSSLIFFKGLLTMCKLFCFFSFTPCIVMSWMENKGALGFRSHCWRYRDDPWLNRSKKLYLCYLFISILIVYGTIERFP